MTPEEALLAAAEDQAKYGHGKGAYFSVAVADGDRDAWETAPACSLGSISRVTQAHRHTLTGNYGSATRLLAEQIRRERPDLTVLDDYGVVSRFNDQENTSAEDVILMMKKAAHG